MVAISDHMKFSEAFNELSNRQQLRGHNRMVVRTLSSFFGTTLMLSAVGLWLLVSDMWDAEMMLMRLLLSLFLFAAGAIFVQNGRERVSVEFEIDTKIAQLRILERGEDGIARLKTSVDYKDVGYVDLANGILTLKGHQGKTVLSLPLGQVDNLAEIEAVFAPLLQKTA